jgi:very-short-patch-repair endonuclease
MDSMSSAPDIASLVPSVIELTGRIQNDAHHLLEALPQALEDVGDDERARLAEFKGSMSVLSRSGSADEQRQIEQVWDNALCILRHLPLWAVTNLSVASRLPLLPGMFDVVIIDEASQNDIASALPLLARAKRAVIVGDPAQLQHVSTLSVDRERELLERSGLLKADIGRFFYREISLFDLAASARGVAKHFLRDHYRCADSIADYFNDEFYGGRLRVLTSTKALRPPPGVKPGVYWTHVVGPITPAQSGCYAPAEIDAILAHLRHLLCEEGYGGTIGVVTPFREQATRLADRIVQELPADRVAASNLGAFTAHQFQGDARDVILLSLCGGPDMPVGSRVYLEGTGNLMNVAVSRARAVCQVFGNRAFAASCGISHVSALVRTMERRAVRKRDRLFDSPWEERLCLALKGRGLDPIPQYPLAGRFLDLALVNGEVKLDVEVDGSHRGHRNPDGSRTIEDLWRDHQITGLGWRVKRFWVYQLKEDMKACVDDIVTALEP